MRSRICNLLASALVVGASSWSAVAQEPIGFIEKFALSADRTKPLQELIPGSMDFYYYHCLHLQNTGRLAEAEAILQQWSANLPGDTLFQRMYTRQRLLSYGNDPDSTLQYLRNELGINLEHAPPQADRAKDLSTSLDPKLLDHDKVLNDAIGSDPNLGGLNDRGLSEVLGREWNMDQVRVILQRLNRVDLDGIVPLMEKELRSQDSRGWNAFPIHQQLTLAQRDSLIQSLPNLLENDAFVRQYLIRLLPGADESVTDIRTRRAHLERLEAFTDKLPASQNSLKAHVLFQRLMLDADQNNFDRKRFEKYLALPRNQFYYNPQVFQKQPNILVADLNWNGIQETRMPPIGDDSGLIRRYLEHFFQTDELVDSFAPWLERGYLDSVFIETKILYGIGSSSVWYAKLNAEQQKAIRDRVELRFAFGAPKTLKPSDEVQLTVDVKNVPKLIVRIYQINPLNVYRKQGRPVSTDIDLDGLVANHEETLSYDVPADRRHRETISLPQCVGRGAWVVDLLGGGLRSRSLIVKGQLRSSQQITDAGHEFLIFDEEGQPVPTATIELGNRTYSPDKDGAILIPFSESSHSSQILLVDGQSTTVESFEHQRDSYFLQLGAILQSQNLLSGAKGSIILRTSLGCVVRPVSIKALEDAQLIITTIDMDGTNSVQTIPLTDLKDNVDSTHQFLVPQRLRTVQVTVKGKVLSVSRQVREDVSATRTIQLNDTATTSQIGDFFLVRNANGYTLQVRGRNGEAIPRLPVSVQIGMSHVNVPVSVTLATDAEGTILLGAMPEAHSIQFSAEGFQARSFALQVDSADWPDTIHLAEGQTYRLPWVSDLDQRVSPWTLVEMRSNAVMKDWTKLVRVADGQLELPKLDPGHYVLQNYDSGTRTEIHVAKGPHHDGFVLSGAKSLEISPAPAAAVSKSEIVGGKLRIQIADANASTRVHLIASPFVLDEPIASQFRTNHLVMQNRDFFEPLSFFIDSLKLDEEYQYILQRQYATKFPGNLLAQPSLLLNPWDNLTTTNDRLDAASGEAPPASAAAPMSADALSRAGLAAEKAAASAGRSSYEYLAKSAILLANRRPNESGWIELPTEGLTGYQQVTVVVTQNFGLATKTIPLASTPIPVADLRLAKSFEEGRHLSQQQQVRIIEANQKTDLGDARSTRIQVYSSLGELFRLYRTLLPSDDFAKFEKLSNWHKLKDDEKLGVYNELVCHELNVFLYMKDRVFFDKVIRPYMANKLAPQLIDLYLQDAPLTAYQDLWQRNRLNTLERILLADKLATLKPGVRKWVRDAVEASPISPEIRTQMFLAALSSSSLDLDKSVEFFGTLLNATDGPSDPGQAPAILGFGGGMGGGGMGGPGGRLPARGTGGLGGIEAANDFNDAEFAGKLAELELAENKPAGEGGAQYFDNGRAERWYKSEDKKMKLRRDLVLAKQVMLYQSLAATRQWADTNFYRTRLDLQNLSLVPPGPLWKQLSEADSLQGFLSTEVHLAARTLPEAILALAMIDLPLAQPQTQMAVEEGRLQLTSPNRCLVFAETIEEAKPKDDSSSVMVGHDIYLVSPGADIDPQKPVTNQALLRGVGYRSSVVVTNPSGTAKTISVLTQLPQGSLPLEGGKFVRSHSLRLEPYSTQQVQYSYYFPASGEYTAYGAQATVDGKFGAESSFAKLRVLDKPESLDQETWGYVALWGTNDQVLEFLRSKNSQQVNLDLIAFRMQDKAFFVACLTELESQGLYSATLWAYSLRHRDASRILQFLSQNDAMVSRMGPVFKSPIAEANSASRYDYEHLDYRPLVLARSHQLGESRKILNDRLAYQYNRLLERIAYQSSIPVEDRMAMTYYLLIQNRIDEALAMFESVDAEKLTTKVQYDYFDAYLDFFRGRYDRAAKIAERYADYSVPRWRDLFAQIRLQVAQQVAMVNGTAPPTSEGSASDVTDPIQRLLLDSRQSMQMDLASEAPALDLKTTNGKLVLGFQNVKQIEVRYYLMDIELLFSRNPFVQQDGGALVAIQPNVTQAIELTDKRGSREIEIPKELANRNLLVEVTSGALRQSQAVYANLMSVNVVESFGRLQVTTGNNQPVDKAYVKVYARHADGQVRFFKDGYTDLRGQFDYASISTNDLDTTQKLSILVLHPERGALIREVAPPKR